MDDKLPPSSTPEPPSSTPQSVSRPLSEEAVKRIAAEEQIRFEIQKQIRRDDGTAESKRVKFLNSPFGLFLLGAIFISGLGGAFQWWQQRVKEDDTRRTVQKKILSEYRWRLNDLDKLVSEAGKTPDIEVKGADSILVYRIAYGAREYRTSLPQFQNASWGGLINQLDEFGISDGAAQAIAAADILMSGPYAGKDSIKRGYFGPNVLEQQASVLHLYYDNARKRVYDTSVWRVFR